MSEETIKLTPLGDRVLIDFLKLDFKSKGGVVLPDQYREKNAHRGIILEIGDECKKPLKIGQEVVFSMLAGTDLLISGKHYLVMKETEILLIIERVHCQEEVRQEANVA